MHKTAPAQVKAVATDEEGNGVVEALVATWDLDSAGDRIVPGAFAASLKEWTDSGRSIPFVWSHMHDDPDAYLGDVVEAIETDDGLLVKAQLDMDDDRARKVFRLLKGGRVNNYSFAYEVRDSEEKDGENLLKDLRVFEVGPTLIGMNQNTRTLVAKRGAALAKRGRTISAANEKTIATAMENVREAADLLDSVLAQLAEEDPEGTEPDEAPTDETQEAAAHPAEPQKAEEPHGAKADEATPTGPVDDDLLLELQLLTQEA